MKREPKEPKPVGAQETLDWYSRNAETYGDSIEEWAPEQLSDFLAKVPEGGSIVDLGCAAGRDSALMAKEGYSVHGVDAADGMIAEARRRHPDLDFSVGDVRNLPFDDASKDGVWARAVLLHLETEQDVDAALSEIARVAKEGAAIHIHVKAQTGRRETEVTRDKLTGAQRFFRYYTLEGLSEKLEAHGIDAEGLTQYDQADRPGTAWITGIVQKKAARTS